MLRSLLFLQGVERMQQVPHHKLKLPSLLPEKSNITKILRLADLQIFIGKELPKRDTLNFFYHKYMACLIYCRLERRCILLCGLNILCTFNIWRSQLRIA
jgi:hypothetical protein